MRSYMYKGKIKFILLCFAFCMLFTGCNGSASQKNNTAEGALSSRADLLSETASPNDSSFIVPQEIAMEFFGINLLKVNRPIWEEHVFSLYDPAASEYSVQFTVGAYEITNSYLNFENKDNLSTYIKYGENSRGLSILFDENDQLKKIQIESDMGEEFVTSFLNIGDNVKDYLEAVQSGLWDKFLADEMNRVEQGWYIRHSVAKVLESSYDVFQISNDDMVVSYFITDELVDSIFLTVVGDIHIDDTSVYSLDNFEFYLNGIDMSTMSIDDWTNFMYLPEADVRELTITNEELIEDPLTGESYMKTEVMEEWKEFYCPMEGTEIFIYGIINAQSSHFQLYNINDVNKRSMETEVCYEFRDFVEPDRVDFHVTDERVEQEIHITGASREITGNYIMPGDNIRTFLNSLEEGFYEKLVSIPNNEYQIEPYRFVYCALPDNTEGVIEIRRDDERMLPPVDIYFKDEIVTEVVKH